MRTDWPSIGVRFFSWIAGIALVLAALLFFRGTAANGWLGAAIGLVAGIALLLVGELRIARSYPVTANAIDAAGIGILSATLYAMHTRWALVSLPVALAGMAIVTAAAVALATRRGSQFIALLGLLGGFVTAALLSSGESSAVAVFAYLLLLNVGITAIALREGWPRMMALSVALTAIAEWAWVFQSLDVGQLLLGAGIFGMFAVVGTSPLWYGQPDDRPLAFRRIAAAAGLMPLLFAIFVAAHSNFGPRCSILFGFLLLADAGLLAIAGLRGPRWLYVAGGIGTLLTLLIWFRVSYTHPSWPWTLLWFAAFIALYLVRVTPFAHLLFFVFIGLAIHEPQHSRTILAAMLTVLAIVVAVTILRGQPVLGAIAIALSSVALMALTPTLWLLLAVHLILFAAFLEMAGISERYVLAVLAIPLFVAMVITAAHAPDWPTWPATTMLLVAAVPYVPFMAFPLVLGARVKASLAPYVAAVLAGVVLFFSAWGVRGDLVPAHRWALGLVPLAEGLMMLALLWRAPTIAPREPRFTLLASTALAFVNAAIPMLLPKPWVAVVWAMEAAGLVWLFTRRADRVLLTWAMGLALAVFLWLAFDADFYSRWYVYVLCGLAMFAAAYLVRLDVPILQRLFSVAGLFEIWFLLNIFIANGFHSANGALNFDFMSSTAPEVATFTVAWAVIATGLLIGGFLLRWPAARGAALALLLATIIKCFLNDVPHLEGVALFASLLGLSLSLVVVGVTIQKFRSVKAA
jgi:Predicted membrane protein (DUF2339)